MRARGAKVIGVEADGQRSSGAILGDRFFGAGFVTRSQVAISGRGDAAATTKSEFESTDVERPVNTVDPGV